MLLVAGCYERFVFGYKWSGNQEDGLVKVFTNAAHHGPVRSAAAAGPFLAVGGSDDTVHMYDVRDNRDLGLLIAPSEGAVTALTFFTPQGRLMPTHLFTGSADGSISFWTIRSGDWECIRTIRKAHKKEVIGLSIHPSGSLALSIGRDKDLKMWDLARGRYTFTGKLPGTPESLSFSPDGQAYAIVIGDTVSVHSVGGSGVIATFGHPHRVLCQAFYGDDTVVTGTEDGGLYAWSIKEGKELVSVPDAHGSRIRAVSLLPASRVPDTEEVLGSAEGEEEQHRNLPACVFSACSDGTVKVWDLRQIYANGSASEPPKPLAELSTKARLTCLVSAFDAEQLAELTKRQLPLKLAVKPARAKKDDRDRKEGEKKPTKSAFAPAPEGVVDFMDEDDAEAQRRKQAATRAKLANRKRTGQNRPRGPGPKKRDHAPRR